jgi:hypothetical protein
MTRRWLRPVATVAAAFICALVVGVSRAEDADSQRQAMMLSTPQSRRSAERATARCPRSRRITLPPHSHGWAVRFRASAERRSEFGWAWRTRRAGARRELLACGVIVLFAHAGIVAALIKWRGPIEEGEVGDDAIIVEFQPEQTQTDPPLSRSRRSRRKKSRCRSKCPRRCSPQGLTAARAAARGDPRRRPTAKPRPRGHRDLEKPDRHHSGAQQALSERGAFARRAGHGAARLQHQPGRASAVEPHRDQLRIGRARCGGACSSGACTTFSATAAGACRQGVDGPAALQHPLRCRDSGTTRNMVRFHRST